MKIEDIEKLDGKGFSALMQHIKEKAWPVWDAVMKRYFDDLDQYDDPIVESWNEDPDDVWDAEASFADLAKRNKAFREMIEEYENEKCDTRVTFFV